MFLYVTVAVPLEYTNTFIWTNSQLPMNLWWAKTSEYVVHKEPLLIHFQQT